MYVAELRGKLTPRMEGMEDVLTSNVFSFFKYSDRQVFLKGYIDTLGLTVSDQDAVKAEFLFWHGFEDRTQPDLIIKVGKYYLLFEAKYFSQFGEAEDKTDHQLLREITGGKIEAESDGLDFNLIAITADYYYKPEKFEVIPNELSSSLKWTNWQAVARFLQEVLETNRNLRNEDRLFAQDLYDLLDKKKLRDYHGAESLARLPASLQSHPYIFLEAKTVQFRGDFIGFAESLSFPVRIVQPPRTIFLHSRRQMFESLLGPCKLRPLKTPIFFKEGKSHD